MIASLNPRRWTYWFKLTAVTGTLILTLLVLLVGIYEARARAEADDRLRDYVHQAAITRKARLEDALDNARSTITETATAAYLRPRLLRLLQITGTPSSADIVARSEASDLLRFRLVENGLFEYVRVLTPDGIVAASVYPVDIPADQRDLVGTDNSESPGYHGALDAQVLGETQRLIVYQTAGLDQAEIVQVLEFDNEIIGFLIGRLSLQNIMFDNITDRVTEGVETPLHIVSYLATRAGTVLADSSVRDQAVNSARRSPITAALTGQTGFAEYLVQGVNAPVIAYYQSVAGTPLALITEVPNTRQLGQLTVAAFASAPWLIPSLVGLAALMVFFVWRDTAHPLRLIERIIGTGLEDEMEFEIPTQTRHDMFGSVTRGVLNIRQQLTDSLQTLKGRMQASLRDVEATQEVGRSIATQRDQEILMGEVVNLIIKVFSNIYHAQIFMNDQLGDFAVLRASTGEAGERLLERGHRLPIGGNSVVGRTVSENVITVVLDTEASELHHKNELLPNTRGELAIPLRLGGDVIGALDVQSLAANSFTDDQIATLQAMADQIAISIENARLYQESVRALDEIAKANRRATADAWREHLFGARSRELVAWSGTPTRTDTESLRVQAIKTGHTQIGGMTGQRTIPVAVPINLRGQVLGAVVWELPIVEYSDEKVQLAEELVNRLAVSLDNARLFEDSQRIADRERLLNEIAAKITAQNDIESILTTAVKEVGQALRTPNVKLRLGLDPAKSKLNTGPLVRLNADLSGNHSNGNGYADHPHDSDE